MEPQWLHHSAISRTVSTPIHFGKAKRSPGQRLLDHLAEPDRCFRPLPEINPSFVGWRDRKSNHPLLMMAIQLFIMCALRGPVRQKCQFVRDVPHPHAPAEGTPRGRRSGTSGGIQSGTARNPLPRPTMERNRGSSTVRGVNVQS
jgi:hypothetical protein